jgi:3-dehydroquinate synthase
MKLVCTFPASLSRYEIEIGSGLLKRQSEYLATLGSRFAIITDDQVASLYGNQLLAALAGLEAYLFSFPHGEKSKTRSTKDFLEDQLFEKGLGRDTCVIALGGGVVTDIAGYAAATFCRGVPLVMMPTSLLAMADASIGGKTGVNTPYGKNLLGCIYQPKKVVIDPLTLKSLPESEIKNGVVEIIKHGLIADRALFEYLEERSDPFLKLEAKVVEKAIFESVRIKKEIVEQDEKCSGKRNMLNFGHTIGHALEVLTHYQIPHGQAVAIGIVVESYLSMQTGFLPFDSFRRIQDIFARFFIPASLPAHLNPQTILDAMTLDKKSLAGQPRFAIIDEIGSSCSFNAQYCTHVEKALIQEALENLR